MSDNRGSRVEEEPLVPPEDLGAPLPFTDEDVEELRRSWNADKVAGKPNLESLVAYCAGLSAGSAARIRAQLTQDIGLIDLVLKVDEIVATLRSTSWAGLQELAHKKPKETGDLLPEVARTWLRLIRSHAELGAAAISPARSQFLRQWLLRFSAPKLATVRGEEPDDDIEPQLIDCDLGQDVECSLESARIDDEGTLAVSVRLASKTGRTRAMEGHKVILSVQTGGARRDVSETTVSGGRAAWRVELGGGAETVRLSPPPASALSVRRQNPADPEDGRGDRTILIAPVRDRISGRMDDQVELAIAATAEGENISLAIDARPATRKRYGDGTLVLDLSVAGGWQRLGEWPFSEQAVRIEDLLDGSESPITERLSAEILLG